MSSANYVILDGAKLGQEMDEAKRLNPDHVCLYSGNKRKYLNSIAPYLFSFKLGTTFSDWVLKNSFGNSWGVFIRSNQKTEIVWKHIRHYMVVQSESGDEMGFRFYDPRVLHIFIATCTNKQLKEFFGPAIDAFLVEDKEFFKHQESKTLISNDQPGNFTEYTLIDDSLLVPDEKIPGFEASNLKIRTSISLTATSNQNTDSNTSLASIEKANSETDSFEPDATEFEIDTFNASIHVYIKAAANGTGFLINCKNFWNNEGFDPNKIQTLFDFFSFYGMNFDNTSSPCDAESVASFVEKKGINEAKILRELIMAELLSTPCNKIDQLDRFIKNTLLCNYDYKRFYGDSKSWLNTIKQLLWRWIFCDI